MTIIRICDVESTGLAPPAQVCEIGFADYDTETQEISLPWSSLHMVEAMPPEARAIHHIGMADLEGCAPFDATAVRAEIERQGVWGFAAHNAAFEAQWLGEVRICTYKAALRIWPDAPSHGNMALRYWLEDQGKLPKLDIPIAHRAGPDAYVTAHVLRALFQAGATGKDMVAWTKEPAVLPRCPIGKYRGQPWAEVDDGMLRWMIGKDDLGEDVRWNAQREMDRRSK